jgi:hypothetical protein
MCREHPGHLLELFCTPCHKPVCLLCANLTPEQRGHQGHPFVRMDVAVRVCKDDLKEVHEEADAQAKSFKIADLQLQAMVKDLFAKKKEAEVAVDSACQVLHREVEDLRSRHKATIAEHHQRKVTELRKHIFTVQQHHACMASVAVHAKADSDLPSEVQMLVARDELSGDLGLAGLNQQAPPLISSVDPELAFELEGVQAVQFLRQQGRVLDVSEGSPANCSIHSPGSSCVVGQEMSFTVTLRDNDDQPVKGPTVGNRLQLAWLDADGCDDLNATQATALAATAVPDQPGVWRISYRWPFVPTPPPVPFLVACGACNTNQPIKTQKSELASQIAPVRAAAAAVVDAPAFPIVGPHQLALRLLGVHLRGSPIQVTVHAPPEPCRFLPESCGRDIAVSEDRCTATTSGVDGHRNVKLTRPIPHPDGSLSIQFRYCRHADNAPASWIMYGFAKPTVDPNAQAYHEHGSFVHCAHTGTAVYGMGNKVDWTGPVLVDNDRLRLVYRPADGTLQAHVNEGDAIAVATALPADLVPCVEV